MIMQNVKPSRVSIRVFAYCAALACVQVAAAVCLLFVSAAYAQTVPAADTTARAFGWTVSGNTVRAPLVNLDGPFVPKYQIEVQSAGSLKATAAGVMPVAGGVGSVPVSVAGTISKASSGALVGRALLKSLPVLGTGIALWDLANELDFRLLNPGGGVPTVEKKDPAVCSVAPCYQYRVSGGDYGQTYQTSQAAALSNYCTVRTGPFNSVWMPLNTYGACYVAGADLNFPCPQYGTCSAGSFPGYGSQTVSPSSPSYLASSAGELEAAIAAKASWAGSSALGRAAVQAVKLNDAVPITSPVVTGPGTTPGGTTVTTDAAANTTTTSTTTNNHTYAGDTMTTTNTTTNVTVDNTTSNVINTTTISSTPVTPEAAKTDCEKNPSALGCINTGEVDNTVKLPTLDSGFSSISAVAFADSSTCPSPVSFSVIGQSYAISYQPMCDAGLSYIRPIILLLASVAAVFVFTKSFQV
jgi:hypothetical protein